MKLDEFKIGTEFNCGGSHWRCTDVGSRVVVAINLSRHDGDPKWFNGPPYAVAEEVFDEHDLPNCEQGAAEEAASQIVF